MSRSASAGTCASSLAGGEVDGLGVDGLYKGNFSTDSNKSLM